MISKPPSPNARYYAMSKREEAKFYTSESFSSEYLDSSESFEPDDVFAIEDIIADRLRIDKDGMQYREYQVAWTRNASQLTWELESRLQEDCSELVKEYKNKSVFKLYRRPSKKKLSRFETEELQYEAQNVNHKNDKKRRKIRDKLRKELLDLECFEDFALAGHTCFEKYTRRSRTNKRKAIDVFTSSSSSDPSSTLYIDSIPQSANASLVHLPEVPTVEEISELLSSEEVPVPAPCQPLATTTGWKSTRSKHPPCKISSPSHTDTGR